MNAITKASDSPVNQLRAQLMQIGPELRNALPSHIKPEKFQRVVMTVVQTTPELLAAERKSLLGSCMKCAADGLVPDGREAALVIYNVNVAPKGAPKQWVKKVQYMPMLAGIQKRVRNSGEIASIEAHVIYSEDHFVWDQGLHGNIEHKPKFPGPRGNPIGAYAVARFKDGSAPQFEVMDVQEINRVRSKSRAADSGPWAEWWTEMARKTVFRRLSKWLPMDAEADELMRRDDENGAPTEVSPSAPMIDGESHETPEIEYSAPTSKLDALEGASEDGELFPDPPTEAEPEAA